MPKTRPWRELIESNNAGLTAVSALTPQETAAKGEEPALRTRELKAETEHALALGTQPSRQETWFYPVTAGQTWNFYDAVLGWNHALILRPLELGLYAPEFVLQWKGPSGRFAVHGGIGIDVSEVGEEMEQWTVHAIKQKVPLRRVTTYNATTCSVSVVFPESGSGRIILSHIDATPPIPISACLHWCAQYDKSVIQLSKVQSTRKLRCIASICAHEEEAGKFDTELLGGMGWSYSLSTLVLSRGRIVGDTVGPSEFHTQCGLEFSRSQLPRLRAFLWAQPRAYMTLLPASLPRELERIASRYEAAARSFRTADSEQASKESTEKKKYWPSKSKLADFEQSRKLLAQDFGEARNGLDIKAIQALNPLLKGEHGLTALHGAVFQALLGLNTYPGFNAYLAVALDLHAALQDPMSPQMDLIDQQIEQYRRRLDIVLSSANHSTLLT